MVRVGGYRAGFLLLIMSVLVAGCQMEHVNFTPEDASSELDTSLPDPADPNDPIDPTDPTDPVDPSAPCVTLEDFFISELWAPLMSTKCIACHNSQGAAKDTKMVLQYSAITGFLEHNLEALRDVASYQYDGESILLLKPTNQIDHAGGEIITADSPEYAALQELIFRFENPIDCVPDDVPADAFFEGVELAGPYETFRQATLLLAGRLPTVEERSYLKVGGFAALEPLLDDLLNEEGFYEWLKEVYNDLFLTDRYITGNRASNLLDGTDYPNRRWYDAEEPMHPANIMTLGQLHANRAVGQEALELIAYIARHDHPFHEVVTADYMVVNPFSAISYGVEDQVTFENITDENEFHSVQLPGIPHAGVLTSSMFLNRFPTTDTNVNRHRSRILFSFFLATDVMKLAQRPIDPTSIQEHNPTMFNADCAVCHDVIDPLAGGFQNWDAAGRYRPPDEGWHGDMLPPGYGEEAMPYPERYQSLQWVAHRIASDERFMTSTIHTLFKGLTGLTPARPPSEEETEIYAELMATYDSQDELFSSIREDFAGSNYNIKTVAKALIMSPWFRAKNIDFELDDVRMIELKDLGTGRLATPEQLNRRLTAVIGFPWRNNRTSPDNLVVNNRYRIFYGGIDSDDVIGRITDPNGLIVAVQQRMAGEVACLSVGRDFSLLRHDRHLFPFVEPSYVPDDENGFPIPQAQLSIRENIRHLHAQLLGEQLSLDDPEIQHTYDLFYETRKEGLQAISDDTVSVNVDWRCSSTVDYWSGQTLSENRRISADPDYTIRSWMAVLSYLLSDYRLLYQ
ncbi:MAG: hypothetical protein CMH54_14535 [Myxococcales bacterium]|nr:hypothetical protein [Myxococcales bacterium]